MDMSHVYHSYHKPDNSHSSALAYIKHCGNGSQVTQGPHIAITNELSVPGMGVPINSTCG